MSSRNLLKTKKSFRAKRKDNIVNETKEADVKKANLESPLPLKKAEKPL